MRAQQAAPLQNLHDNALSLLDCFVATLLAIPMQAQACTTVNEDLIIFTLMTGVGFLLAVCGYIVLRIVEFWGGAIVGFFSIGIV